MWKQYENNAKMQKQCENVKTMWKYENNVKKWKRCEIVKTTWKQCENVKTVWKCENNVKTCWFVSGLKKQWAAVTAQLFPIWWWSNSTHWKEIYNWKSDQTTNCETTNCEFFFSTARCSRRSSGLRYIQSNPVNPEIAFTVLNCAMTRPDELSSA